MSRISFRYLLENGAKKEILTDDGERALDLCQPRDFATIRLLLADQVGASQDDPDSEDNEEKDSDNQDDELNVDVNVNPSAAANLTELGGHDADSGANEQTSSSIEEARV